MLDATNLPEAAVPFVRELVLELARRAPATLGTPPRFTTEELATAAHCSNSARSLVQWFDTVPDTLGQRMEELEAVFHALLGLVQGLDQRVRRAVFEARSRAEEESAFVAGLHDVLLGLQHKAGAANSIDPAGELVDELLRRIQTRDSAGSGSPLRISAFFDPIQADLDQLRGDIAKVEQHTRALREQSLRDPLTGLWNRRAYTARVDEEVRRAVRYGFPLSLGLWDVDQLSAINRQHGHPTGDLILQALAGRVMGELRRCDFLARIDGEEFAVLFTSTHEHQAAAAAAKICATVAGTPVDTPAGPIRVTASAGVAGLRDGDTPAALGSRAAQALAAAQRRRPGEETTG